MTKEKIWAFFVVAVCILLTFSAFFADKLSLYDFHMEVMDYSYEKTDRVPAGADTAIWFDYGTHGRNLFYGYTDETLYGQAEFFMRTADGIRELSQENMQEFPADSLGNLVVALPVQLVDVDGDGDWCAFKKMRKEIPDAVKWFRLASYVLLMVMPFLLKTNY